MAGVAGGAGPAVAAPPLGGAAGDLAGDIASDIGTGGGSDGTTIDRDVGPTAGGATGGDVVTELPWACGRLASSTTLRTATKTSLPRSSADLSRIDMPRS